MRIRKSGYFKKIELRLPKEVCGNSSCFFSVPSG